MHVWGVYVGVRCLDKQKPLWLHARGFASPHISTATAAAAALAAAALVSSAAAPDAAAAALLAAAETKGYNWGYIFCLPSPQR